MKVIPDHCLKGLRELCDEKGILLICDEIQCGYYRSGKFFAHQYANIKPDIVPFAKAVAGGYPSGGCLFVKKVADCMKVGISWQYICRVTNGHGISKCRIRCNA